MTNKNRDNLYASPLGQVPAFRFDKAVVDVFPDMIRRSVPGYETIINLTGELAARFVQPNTNCYDLGCSLGASSLAVLEQLGDMPATIVAVDNSDAMLSRCRELLSPAGSSLKVKFMQADIRHIPIDNASLVILNFTLQFVPVSYREALLKKIYRGLNLGGCLVLSEKLRFEPQALDDLLSDLHHQFKRAHGYSDLEISQKRDALEEVLVTETLQTHIERLKNCGFSSASSWFQCFNFCSLIAVK